MAAGVVGVLAVIVSLFMGGRPAAAPDPAEADGAAPDAPTGSGPAAGEPTAPVKPTGAERVDATPGAEAERADAAPIPVAEPAPVGADGHDVSAPGVRVHGQVDLAGPGEAVVTLVDEHGGQHGRTGTRAGRYELDLPTPGAWLLVVSAPGHAPHAERLVAAGSSPELTHHVTLPASASTTADRSSTPREPQPAAGS
jgi:DHA2 family lincomycin resistance protein-like MFS transporter